MNKKPIPGLDEPLWGFDMRLYKFVRSTDLPRDTFKDRLLGQTLRTWLANAMRAIFVRGQL